MNPTKLAETCQAYLTLLDWANKTRTANNPDVQQALAELQAEIVAEFTKGPPPQA